jgi:predicted RNA-binding protein
MTRFWLAAISKEHICMGVEGGFIQVCHGKKGPLAKMKKGDFILVYSSKSRMNDGEKLQKFTAIGQIISDEVYQFQMYPDFVPFRKNVQYFDSEETSIIPLIDDLNFIRNKKQWGYPFRFGLLEISEHDFGLIASKMIKDEDKG